MQNFIKKLSALATALALVLTTVLGTTPALAADAAATTGSFTITSTNAEFAGKSVSAYKMFSATPGANDSVGYKLESAWEGFFTGKIGLTSTGDKLSNDAYAYVAALKDGTKGEGLIKFAQQAAQYAKDNTLTAAKTVKAGTTTDAQGNYVASFSGNDALDYGYYLFVPAGGSTSATRGTDAILDNVTSETGTAALKSKYPSVSKTVENAGQQENHSSAQVGQDVKFTLNSEVPDTTQYTTYTFILHDTLSEGLDFNDDVKVTVGGAEYTNYTKTFDKANSKLVLNFSDNIKNLTAGDNIVVTYSAKLNEKAVAGQDKANNKAYVEYSNNPGGTGTGESVPSITHTYDFAFDLHKVDDDGTTALPGAEFSLTDPDGKAVTLIAEGDGYRPVKDGETGVTTVTTPNNGTIKFTGLKEGTYKLTEVNAPAGYNKLSAPVDVKIEATYNPDGTLNKYTVTANGTENTTVTVQNKKGSTLPTTGGMGTVAFTVIGVAIVAAGTVWVVSRKRSSN